MRANCRPNEDKGGILKMLRTTSEDLQAEGGIRIHTSILRNSVIRNVYFPNEI